jgi:hypothetical protein
MRSLALLSALVVLAPGAAHADRYDFRLYQLGAPATDPSANARFGAFVNELGMAICNWNLEPPETTGYSGFNFAFEYPVSLINDKGTLNGKPYWPLQPGTTGSGALQMPGVHIRKGLPYSFEVGVKVNYIEQSNMVASTIEAKWALNEGFLYFPDLAVRGFGTQLIGSREFNLTVAGLDIGLGKQFAINGQMTLTPYVGWSSVWVAATSNVVDFNPGQTEKQQFSGGTGGNASGTASQDVFQNVDLGSNRHNRFYGGVRFISYVVEFGLEASYGLVSTEATDYTIATYSAKIGLDF